MEQKRNRRIKNIIITRFIPIVMLFATFTFMFGVTAFSSGTGTKTITYGESTWNLNQDFGNRNWTSKNETATFTLDLSEDYKNAGDTSERPFTIKGGSFKYDHKNGIYTITVNLPKIGENHFTITIFANSWANQSGQDIERSFTIKRLSADSTGPEISITGAANGGIYSDSRTINITVKDESSYKVDSFTAERIDINGQKHSLGKMDNDRFNAEVSEEGRYNFHVVATDEHGNQSEKRLNFTIDRSVPQVTGKRDNDTVKLTIKDYTLDVSKTSAALYESGTLLQSGITFTKKDNFTGEATVKLPTDGSGNVKIGTYVIEWQSTDGAGKKGSGYVSYTVGNPKPAITISGVNDGGLYNTNKPVTISITNTTKDRSKVTVTRNNSSYDAGELTVNGGVATLKHTFDKGGTYTIKTEATDTNGNKTTKTVSFTIDKTPPTITPYIRGENTVIKNGAYYNKTFTPYFSLKNKNDQIVSVMMNGRNVTGNIPKLSEGKYHFVVKARDRAGNTSELTLRFTIDTTPPTLDISGVMEGYLNEDVIPVITYYDANLDRERTKVTLNGEPYESGTKLELEQDYVLEAYIVDLAGNVTEASLSFTIDKTAPVIKFMEPISAQYFNSSIIPELIIEELSEFEILRMTLNGEPYEIGREIEEEGKHILEIEVKDKAGNIQTLAVEFTIDMTPPELIIEGVEKDGIYSDTVFIKIGLADPKDRFLRVTVNGELYKGEVVEKGEEKYIRITVSQLGDHELKVIAVDEAGNRTEMVIPFSIVEKTALQKFFDNKPLFAGTIAGAAIILGTAGIFGYRYNKRRKLGKEIEEDYFN